MYVPGKPWGVGLVEGDGGFQWPMPPSRFARINVIISDNATLILML